MANKHMSLESVLDEERRDVLALLEGPSAGAGRKRSSASSTGSGRASSPLTKPQSPVRSMLDIDDDFVAWHSSLNSSNGVATSPRQAPVRSMLDIGSTPAPNSPPIRSMLDVSVTPKNTVSSPTEYSHRAKAAHNVHPRSLSDAASRPAAFGPRASSVGVNIESAYQFTGYLPGNPGAPVVLKRNMQSGKKLFPSAMSEVVRGGDLSVFGRDRGRNSIAGTGIGINNAKSKSPHNRLGLRSNSPHPSPDPSKFVLDDGREIDMSSAYTKLSDANLASSGGGLSSLGRKASRRRTNSGDAEGPDGSRLQKDYTAIDGEDPIEDSSDEAHHSSDDERPRGRKTHIDLKTGMNNYPSEENTLGMGRAKGHRTAQSLLAAAEEERQEIAAQQNAIANASGAKYKIRSMLDPEITVTGPIGDRPFNYKVSKPGVHPNTSFDVPSGLNTPVDSDTEADLTDIKRAQKLSINMTPIVSTPATGRSVRTLYRGDFAKMQKEANDHQRRVRKYLVATDLSEEAAHALEWTIGTVLRDGDTLLAIYCVDEETGITPNDGTVSADERHEEEQVVAIAAAAKPSVSTPIMKPMNLPSPLGPGFRLEVSSASASPMGRGKGKAEQERHRAVQDITERVSKLLRKTKLQVKVVIEVIHCKSPKHLITEVIDYISPTLVILGSRGRSALKGVILGSFSNYLVTKSSVPVMVARKRLRKHTKYKRPAIRLANNLANPTAKSLASAKID